MNQKHNVTAEKLGIQISSGTLAGLAGGAVTISMGETSLFVSATAAATLRPGQDFFPLTVDYREKFTAAGVSGGYFKREGRPSEKEILTSRLCDRPLRPLFPKGFLNEVQVIGYLLSTDLVNEADVLMVNGASAALLISDVPWDGPVGCVRLGEIDGEFVVNPTNEQMYDSTLDLIYVGSEKEMMMIEGSADQIPEDRFVAALEYAHEAIQDIIGAQRQLAELCAKQKKEFELCKAPDEVLALCREITGSRMDEAIFAPSKQERQVAVDVIKEEATAACEEKFGEEFDPDHVKMAFEIIQEEVYRDNILQKGKRRWPGFRLKEVTCETGVPRVHGSASLAWRNPVACHDHLGHARAFRNSMADWRRRPQNPSSCTTTSHPSRLAKQAGSGLPAAGKSDRRPCQRSVLPVFHPKTTSPMPFDWSPRSCRRTDRPPWPVFAAVRSPSWTPEFLCPNTWRESQPDWLPRWMRMETSPSTSS